LLLLLPSSEHDSGASPADTLVAEQPATQAELCFRHALDMARGQQARSLELRAGTSLAHLWKSRGRRAEARNLLAPIYGWFTEGLDTPDLRKAKTLLDALG
jgi:predicted ATPase